MKTLLTVELNSSLTSSLYSDDYSWSSLINNVK